MLGSTECIVSVGSDVKLQWTQTRDVSVNLSIQLIAGHDCLRKRRKKRQLFRQTESWENRDRTVRFQLASGGHHKDSKQLKAGRTGKNGQLSQRDGRERDRRTYDKSRGNQPENIQSEDEHNSESEDDQNGQSQDDQNGQSEDTRPASRPVETNTVPTTCVSCRKIREKVEKKFSKRQKRLRECHSLWMNSPGEFFGDTRIVSSEQWSFGALTDSERKLDQERVPFHKVNLVYHLQKRMEESGLPGLTCRKAMLQEIYPGFEKMQRKDRDPLYRRFERYIEQGEALLMITTGNAGILLTVAGFLSRAELAHLSKEWKSCAGRIPWLTAGILQQSKQYEEVTTIIRTYMQPTPKRRATEPHQNSRNKRLQLPFPDNRVPGRFYLTNGQPRLGPASPEHYQDRVPDDQLASVPLLTPLSSQASSPIPSPSALWEEIETAFAGNWLGNHAYFLLLFYPLDGCVPDLFKRSLLPQRRWTDGGTQQLVAPAQANLDPQLAAILSSPDRLTQALDQIRNLGFVSESSSTSLHSELYTKLSQVLTKQVKEKWTIRALRWLCFIFPRHELWEDSPSFTSIVRSLQPLIEHLVQSVEEANMPRSLKDEVSEALLAASKVTDIRSKALSLVAGLLGDESPPHLHAEFALQRSILLRLDGDFKNSERVIHDFCCRCETPEQSCLPTYFQQRQKQTAELSHRLNALYGLIHRSHLENLVQCEQYELAKEQIDHWQLIKTASPMEWDILPSRTLTTSKIFRSQGAFKCAQQNLELCVKVLHHREPARAQVLCQLADVYNDLGFPGSASELLAPEVEEGRRKTTKTKAFRRFLVSSVETCVQNRQYEEASADLEQLDTIFSNLNRPDVSDQLLHIRTLVASARVCHMRGEFGGAIQAWDVALRHVRSYNSFESEGFTYSAIYLSRSLAYLELGEHESAESSFKCGKVILDRGARDYWIPTFALWVTEVLQKLQTMARWAECR